MRPITPPPTMRARGEKGVAGSRHTGPGERSFQKTRGGTFAADISVCEDCAKSCGALSVCGVQVDGHSSASAMLLTLSPACPSPVCRSRYDSKMRRVCPYASYVMRSCSSSQQVDSLAEGVALSVLNHRPAVRTGPRGRPFWQSILPPGPARAHYGDGLPHLGRSRAMDAIAVLVVVGSFTPISALVEPTCDQSVCPT